MAEVPFEFDIEAGMVRDGALRYLLMRPDVLMGVGRKLGLVDRFVDALEESAFQNARESFEAYRREGKLNEHDFLERTAEFAARLGWGGWVIDRSCAAEPRIVVHNSPFAFGLGPSDVAACGPIKGILRALYLTVLDKEVKVVETRCVSQGAPECCFEVHLPKRPE